MTGNPKVIEGLLTVMGMMERTYESLHNQEHCWENLEYPGLEEWFDEANRDLWKLHHKVIKRIFALGGQPEGVTEDETEAFSKALQAFQALHEQCQAIYEAAEADDDYVTIKALQKIQKCLEGWINAAEAKLGQVGRLGSENFMTEQM